MKNIILVCTLSFLHLFVSGQNLNSIVSEKTKIYIIGVVHYENQFRNTDSLLNILKDIKPDLILAETDTLSGGYFKSDYTLVEPPKWYKMARKLKLGRKMPPELDVLYKYREISNSALIYPFDMAIHNRKKDIATSNNNENKWVKSLNFAYSNNLIPDSILPYHKEFIIFNNWFFEISQRSYKLMNRTIVTDSIRHMMKIEKEYFPKLISTVQSLSEYKGWYFEENNSWAFRNEIMSKNIVRFIEMTNSTKVVVLTGLLHKYYLLDLLNSYNNEQKFELVEYFDK